MAKIGFVGLGHMGLPMAINLIKAGHEVTGYDMQPASCQRFVEAGGMAASSLNTVTAEVNVLITMLQNGTQVLTVCDALLPTLAHGALYIDCSTIDVESARSMHQWAENKGIVAVDAPVSGGTTGATAATLTFMVGGTDTAVQAATPFLTAMGQKIIATGAGGSGQAAKICNNMILGISMIAVSEAFVLAKHLHLAPEKLFEVVTNSSGQCWAMSKYVPVAGVLDNVPANREYQPGFAAAMMLKDLLLSQHAATATQINTPLGKQATELYQQFINEGHGDVDFSAIIKLLAAQEA